MGRYLLADVRVVVFNIETIGMSPDFYRTQIMSSTTSESLFFPINIKSRFFKTRNRLIKYDFKIFRLIMLM